MVKGNELVVCSFAWERTVLDRAEISALQKLTHVLGSHNADVFADVLDPQGTELQDTTALLDINKQHMLVNGVWLVIAAGKRRQALFSQLSMVATDRNMRVIFGCHDEQQGNFPEIEQRAIATGDMFYWGNHQEFFDGVEDVVLPMCDNGVNDINTIWTPERKTA